MCAVDSGSPLSLQGRKNKGGMEWRIRIIWILSLSSAFVLTGVQGYWLYNQYRYAVDTYAEELAAKALQAGEKEHAIRKAARKSFYTYIVQQNTAYSESESEEDNSIRQKMLFAICNYKDSLQMPLPDADPAHKTGILYAQKVLDRIETGASPFSGLPEDSVDLRLFMNAKMSPDSMHAAINRAVTNLNNPFRTELLDSVIGADLPGVRYSIAPWTGADSLGYLSGWKQSGSLLHPAITVLYAYSPFEQKGVAIDIAIPSPPLFKKMAVQLLLALGLILLLAGCLVFQIRTILKQKKVSELRESFVYTMIHELKRPVQALKTFVSFLSDKEMRADEAAANRVAQDSMFELDNLSAYLNKLKDMMRADTESTPLRPVKFNLEELTGKALRLVHIPAGKDVTLSARYDMESPWIEADPVHIANIISNLVENAIKYSGAGVTIEVKAVQKGRELWLTVADNGIGIPLAEQEKVFAKFYRGTNLPDRNIPGIGLGLSYVKLITEAHRGQVSLSSHPGKGTSVTLYLPQ
ncbi:MAG: HAMP domain-containing histidine kinase [Tannerellaceae bacterium]|jgi:two-component system phosphate regulon sensor histidine kinase PhoR|nr:HAMP domain-containing histidine kinase [Tannerellaceae bacterium]